MKHNSIRPTNPTMVCVEIQIILYIDFFLPLFYGIYNLTAVNIHIRLATMWYRVRIREKSQKEVYFESGNYYRGPAIRKKLLKILPLDSS